MIEIKEFIEIPLDRICPQMCLKIHAYSKGENLMLIENEFEQVNEAKYQFLALNKVNATIPKLGSYNNPCALTLAENWLKSTDSPFF